MTILAGNFGPTFPQTGKENITMGMILSHAAALDDFCTSISFSPFQLFTYSNRSGPVVLRTAGVGQAA